MLFELVEVLNELLEVLVVFYFLEDRKLLPLCHHETLLLVELALDVLRHHCLLLLLHLELILGEWSLSAFLALHTTLGLLSSLLILMNLFKLLNLSLRSIINYLSN